MPASRKRSSKGGRNQKSHQHVPAKMEASIKADALRRLRRIEGQIRGLMRMIEEGQDCRSILTQLSATCKALHAVGTEVLRDHLRYRVTSTVAAGASDTEALYDELIELMQQNRC
jgi:CsoR family transcriptional regulator, copper-sensing transcriptional repressor